MSTTATNAGQGTGTGTGTGNNSTATGTGTGGSNDSNSTTGTGTGTGTGTTATGGDDDKPITTSMLKALLGDFRKDVNKDLNGVRGALEKHVAKVIKDNAVSQATAATTTTNDDDDNAGTTTAAGTSTGTGTTTTTPPGNGTTATTTTRPAVDPRTLRAERQLAETLKRVELLEATNHANVELARKTTVDNSVITASGTITWATPKIKVLVENEARTKASMDDHGVVTIDGMAPKEWFDAQYESDAGLRPAPINAGGSGNTGGRSNSRDWTKFDPNDPKNTPADRQGFREYSAALAISARRR